MNKSAGGFGSGVILIWAWGVLFPETPMPPEVAAAVAPVAAGVVYKLLEQVERRFFTVET
jgi:hypothetical protein